MIVSNPKIYRYSHSSGKIKNMSFKAFTKGLIVGSDLHLAQKRFGVSQSFMQKYCYNNRGVFWALVVNILLGVLNLVF